MRTFSNLAISLDGKIADLKSPTKRLGAKFDRNMMDVIRRQADAVLIGANTLRVHPLPMNVPQKKGSKRTKQPANVIISKSGDLPRSGSFWESPENIRFIFTTQENLEKASKIAQDRAFVIAAGKGEVDLRQVLKRLAESGLKNILVEGGGEIMAAFLKANLLQELYVTLTPWIVGGRSNPALVGGDGLPKWAKLKLKSLKRVGEELYLHYRVQGASKL